jgi:hypothetical protein
MEEVTLQMGGGLPEDQWKTIIEWCLVASQTDVNNRKSLLSIEVDSVVIDDDKFDTWVESKLDMALGKQPAPGVPQQWAMAPQQQQMHDHLHIARLGINRGTRNDAIYPGRYNTGERGRDRHVGPWNKPP